MENSKRSMPQLSSCDSVAAHIQNIPALADSYWEVFHLRLSVSGPGRSAFTHAIQNLPN